MPHAQGDWLRAPRDARLPLRGLLPHQTGGLLCDFAVHAAAVVGPKVAIALSNMNILLFLVFGLVVGFIARAVMPGSQRMSILATMLLGVVGSFIGGFVAALLTQTRVLDFNTTGVIGSVIGSLIALAIAGGVFTRGRAII
jgi:uncharacterized membrane protein YeaQ/YmgE (transglycosylase-associated protein family)